MVKRPHKAHEIPTERSIMRLVCISPRPFDVVSNGAVNVTMGADSFFPITRTVFLRTFFKVLADFKEHRVSVPSVAAGKLFDCVVNVLLISRMSHEV